MPGVFIKGEIWTQRKHRGKKNNVEQEGEDSYLLAKERDPEQIFPSQPLK